MGRRYLEPGDQIVANFVYLEIGEDGKTLEEPILGDSEFWYEGKDAFKDDNGKFYIEE